jgi:hypothetical protein
MENPFPWQTPRFEGVVEQYQRTRWLLSSAAKASNEATGFRMLILAVYTARAITEIMLEAAKKQELKGFQGPNADLNRKGFEETYLAGLPHYLLIEKIRIHDFHRFGCVLNSPGILWGGPIKLSANEGTAGISVPIHGPGRKEVIETGKSKVDEQRPLLRNGSMFFDDASNNYLRLDEILHFLRKTNSRPLAG